jgi:hypothetical protein
MALAWASADAISSALPNSAALWSQFTQLSDWTPVFNEDGTRNSNPNQLFYQISTDNQWFHLKNAKFAEGLARTNPQEDFASVWRLYFEDGREADKAALVNKIEIVDTLFTRLQIF